MPEFRKDTISGRWTIIAPERGKRPTDFFVPPEEVEKGVCPLCPGNEHLTPPEVLALGRGDGAPPNSPGWQVRVVPNKYPALVPKPASDTVSVDFYETRPGKGIHEVIVETPVHGKSLYEFSPQELVLVLDAYRRRIESLKKDRELEYVLVFKNRGARAGASLSHDHSQLIALPFVPSTVNNELENARRFYESNGKCVFCKVLEKELEERRRLICENQDFVAFLAFAPRQPLETWIFPRRHSSDFCNDFEETKYSFSEILLEVLRRLEATISRIPYNFVLHTAPLHSEELPYFHWHLEIIPCLTKIAGFEWGSGIYIVPILPEEAAEFLRSVPLST